MQQAGTGFGIHPMPRSQKCVPEIFEAPFEYPRLMHAQERFNDN